MLNNVKNTTRNNVTKITASSEGDAKRMKGFRRINGANWLKDGLNVTYANNSVAFCSPGNMPPHWGLVREVLLRRC